MVMFSRERSSHVCCESDQSSIGVTPPQFQTLMVVSSLCDIPGSIDKLQFRKGR